MSWTSFLGPVLGLAGDLLGGNSAAKAQRRANETNIQLARENREWEERMSNTAYQRATADMLNAGINPMLAVSQGGASTPNTSAATVNPVDAMGRAISSASSKAANAMITSLTLDRMKIDNATAEEKLKQEKLTTAEQTATKDPGQVARGIEQKQAETRLAVSNATIRDIERKIAEATFDSTVHSARQRANILDQEVNINEIRQILMNLDIPEKKAMADWFNAVGAGSPAMKATMTITQWLKYILGK